MNFSKIIKKIFLLAVIFMLSAALQGCDKQKPCILFSSTPFSKELGYTPNNTFNAGDKIYYLLYNPDTFKTRLLKVQVFRKDNEADEFWGYEYLYNRTVELTDKKMYTNHFTINREGYYIFQIFEYTNTLKPVIKGVVKVNK